MSNRTGNLNADKEGQKFLLLDEITDKEDHQFQRGPPISINFFQ